MKKTVKNWIIIKPVVIMVLIITISVAGIASAAAITSPIIAARTLAAEEAAKRELLPEGVDFKPVDDMSNFPSALVAAYKAGNGAGWVFTTETKGFEGTVRAMFGVNAQGSLVAIKVIEHSETEGIGSRVVKSGSDYLKQLLGLSRAGIDGIVATTGASFTSSAMKQAAVAVLDAYNLLSGGINLGPNPPSNLTDEALAAYYGSAVFTDVPGGKVSDAGTVVYGSGFGAFSDVLVAVLFDSSDKIIGLIVDASGETPDIGGMCAEREYTDLYIGVATGADVDVLSGASFTSWGIQEAVDYAIANLNLIKGVGRDE